MLVKTKRRHSKDVYIETLTCGRYIATKLKNDPQCDLGHSPNVHRGFANVNPKPDKTVNYRMKDSKETGGMKPFPPDPPALSKSMPVIDGRLGLGRNLPAHAPTRPGHVSRKLFPT
jgi:hypothetical protein